MLRNPIIAVFGLACFIIYFIFFSIMCILSGVLDFGLIALVCLIISIVASYNIRKNAT